MGDVYEATHLTLGKRVALKVLRAAGGSDEVQQRFLQEGIAASRVRHPNVVEVTDAGTDAGTSYLAMTLLEGESLAAYLQREGRMSVPQAVDTILPLCAALAAAHQAGVLHRDLKPGNIFLADVGRGDPEPVLLDFGISKLLDPVDLSLTENPQFLGTPLYISPEQTDGAPSTSASDQYSLALTLYECLLGVRPFEKFKTSLVRLLRAVSETEIPAPRSMDPSISTELEDILMRALSRDPRERFESILDFGAALLPFASSTRSSLWAHSFVDTERTMTSVSGRILERATPQRRVHVEVDENPTPLTHSEPDSWHSGPAHSIAERGFSERSVAERSVAEGSVAERRIPDRSASQRASSTDAAVSHTVSARGAAAPVRGRDGSAAFASAQQDGSAHRLDSAGPVPSERNEADWNPEASAISRKTDSVSETQLERGAHLAEGKKLDQNEARTSQPQTKTSAGLAATSAAGLPRANWPVYALAAALALFAVLAGVLSLSHTNEASRFEVHVDSVPPGAELTLDGRPVGRAPYRGSFEKDGETHVLRATLPGYAPHQLSFQNSPPTETLTLMPRAPALLSSSRTADSANDERSMNAPAAKQAAPVRPAGVELPSGPLPRAEQPSVPPTTPPAVGASATGQRASLQDAARAQDPSTASPSETSPSGPRSESTQPSQERESSAELTAEAAEAPPSAAPPRSDQQPKEEPPRSGQSEPAPSRHDMQTGNINPWAD